MDADAPGFGMQDEHQSEKEYPEQVVGWHFPAIHIWLESGQAPVVAVYGLQGTVTHALDPFHSELFLHVQNPL